MNCPECKQPVIKAGLTRWRKGDEIKAVQLYKCRNKDCGQYLRTRILK